jgi:hypothetical protein
LEEVVEVVLLGFEEVEKGGLVNLLELGIWRREV